MSTNLRDLSKQFENKEFVKAYFRGVEDGNAVTQRLNRDGATLNSPDLIARLVGWLEEAEPSDESTADATARAEQELAAANLPSQEKEQDEADSGGGSSSDGTTRTTSPTSGGGSKSPAFGSSSGSK